MSKIWLILLLCSCGPSLRQQTAMYMNTWLGHSKEDLIAVRGIPAVDRYYGSYEVMEYHYETSPMYVMPPKIEYGNQYIIPVGGMIVHKFKLVDNIVIGWRYE